MWLFNSDGFVSIVADKDDPDNGELLVRSRDKTHITNLFPSAEVFSKLPSDYQWRAWVSREEVIEAMIKRVEGLNYTNFKNSIPLEYDRYHNACIDVWSAMYRNYH